MSEWSCSVVSDSATPWTICRLPGSSIHGVFQVSILEWIAISFSRRSSWPRDRTHVSCIGRQILYCWATREAPLNELIWLIFHWIFQARIQEWIAISFSRRSSRPRDWTRVSCIVGRCFTVWATRDDSLKDISCSCCLSFPSQSVDWS